MGDTETYQARLWACVRRNAISGCDGTVYQEPDEPMPRCAHKVLTGNSPARESVCGYRTDNMGLYELVEEA